MEYVELGKTGIRASVAGLGAGGHSRLGLACGGSEAQAEALVRAALDLSVTVVDTAAAYGTEEVVGRALRGRRDDAVLCTKATPRDGDALIGPEELRRRVEASLRRLRTDHIDVFYLHAVSASEYPHCHERLLPCLEKLKGEGLVRAVGVTEAFGSDTGHEMLPLAVQDPRWEVVMTGFNLINQSARERVLEQTRARGIGTTNMFAVRRALSQPAALRETIGRLGAQGRSALAALDPEDPLGFLVRPDGAESLADAAYRFCRHEPGIDVVLFGTGAREHLEANVRSILRPPLPEADAARLRELFAGADSESGN